MAVKRILIVGAGLSGSVLARELAEADLKVLVIDKRNHVAGNCYTERDYDTGIMVHRYGAHIFHTDDSEVWNCMRRFCKLYPYVNRLKASLLSGIYSFPINLHTLNQFFNLQLRPREAEEFLKTQTEKIKNPQNFEEKALSLVGKDLYESFFYGYTKKQWGVEPLELPASILKRLPVRFNYNDNYYNHRFQGIPIEGYTMAVQRMLDHKNIEVWLKMSWLPEMLNEYEHVFYTGTVDGFYDYCYGYLGYRTVFWDKSIYKGDFQGTAGINYPDINTPFTRIREHKHYTPYEKHEKSVVFFEYSKETEQNDVPYYPKRLTKDMDLYQKYKLLADKEEKVTFLGRLGGYEYLDMDQAVRKSLSMAKEFLCEKCS